MTTTELMYTFAEHCAGALHFVSGATGAMIDPDPSPGFAWDPPTSDRVANQVDFYSAAFSTVTGVIIVPARPGVPLLPTYLWDPPPAAVPAGTLDPPPPLVPDVAQVARRVRDLAGLPVTDLAAMIGIGRRQFYNLLQRGSASTETELRIHHLGALLERLAGVVGEDSDAIRSALLTPVGSPPRSMFEVALAGEDAKLGEAFDALIDRIERRGLRQVPRAAPRRGGRRANHTRAREALDGLPSLDLGPKEEA